MAWPDRAVENRLSKTADMMKMALDMCTGLTDFDRQLVTYWSVATHMLPNVKIFPILSIKGATGSGKSRCLSLIAKFSYKTREFCMSGYTSAMVRQEMIAAYEGTVVMEEGEGSWKDLDATGERLLSDRCQRNTGSVGRMSMSDRHQWSAQTDKIFGASAVHRRQPFADAALNGRSILVRTRPDYGRQYWEIDKLDWLKEVCETFAEITFSPTELDRPLTIAPRVFDSYTPLILASQACGDGDFYPAIMNKLQDETEELKAAQMGEPDGLVLRAVLDIMSTSKSTYGNIRLSTVAERIWNNDKASFLPRQIGTIARSIGLKTAESHGAVVIAPTLATILHACREVGYGDEQQMATLKSQIPGYSEWVEKGRDG